MNILEKLKKYFGNVIVRHPRPLQHNHGGRHAPEESGEGGDQGLDICIGIKKELDIGDSAIQIPDSRYNRILDISDS